MSSKQIIGKLERGIGLPNEKSDYFVEQPFMSTDTKETGFEKDPKKSKLASKPKIGETIIGDEGITGRIR